ncbi:unnamed protein product [Orchesella dallaii]|uniref:Uncharacterized protein n=1 Tax=Orchesella dallaii TaxID=48710 RepID=A0ABP1PMY9_9HEXA
MGDPQNGNGQSQFNSVITAVPQGETPSHHMIISQSSALNVFVMGTGRATINFGVFPPAQRAMVPQNGISSNPSGMASLSQEPQLQQLGSLGVTGTTVPQSGSDLERERLSLGAAIHPNKLTTLDRDVRCRIAYNNTPPNSPAPSNGSSNDGYSPPSPAHLIQFTP